MHYSVFNVLVIIAGSLAVLAMVKPAWMLCFVAVMIGCLMLLRVEW